ncbi:T9SS type A sorting domain-containing protein [bacterium]|nr:T9SS type A sorting domain-containing protein [bacterium]
MKLVLQKTVSLALMFFLATTSFSQGQVSVPSVEDETPNKITTLPSADEFAVGDSDTVETDSPSNNQSPSSFNRLAPGKEALLDRADPIVFQWNQSVDPDGDNVTYVLEITRLLDGHVTHEEVVDTVDVLDLNTSPLPDSEVHYTWTVHATDGEEMVPAGNGGGSFTFLSVNSVPIEDTSKPEGFNLSAAYPNPFNSMTIIRYHVDETTDVKLTVYNLLGEAVTVLKEGRVTAGSHLAAWRGEDTSKQKVASGTYIVRMEAYDQQTSLRVTFVK